MTVLKRWKVTAEFEGPRQSMTIYVSDNFLGNVVEKVRHIQFTRFPEPEPSKLIIEREPEPNPQTGVLLGGAILGSGTFVSP